MINKNVKKAEKERKKQKEWGKHEKAWGKIRKREKTEKDFGLD